MIIFFRLKPVLVFCILILSHFLLSADIVYKVKKGDTMESIAMAHNTTPQQIRNMNNLIDQVFVGMTLRLPERDDNTLQNSNEISYIDDYFKIGESLFMAGDYKKAAKNFSKSLKYNPSALAYYNRGLCNYNMEKWRQSYEDLGYVIDSNSISAEIKENARELYDIAKQKHEEWSQNRDASIAEFVGLLVGAGATVASAIVVNNSSTVSSTLPASYYYQESNRNYIDDGTVGSLARAYENGSYDPMTQIYRQAQYQTSIEFNNLQNQLKQQEIDFINQYKQLHPNAADGEARQAYLNYISAVQNEMNGKDSNNSSIDNSSNSYDYKSQYERYEKLAKGHFDSLTVIGTRSINNDGYSGTTGSGGTVSLVSNLRDAQKQMTRIRNEAASKGIIISPSKWETATVDLGR